VERAINNLIKDLRRGHLTRRQMMQCMAFAGAAIPALGLSQAIGQDGGRQSAALEGKSLQAVSIEHVSYLVEDYHKTADFYSDLLGMRQYNDTGKAVNLLLADNGSYMVIRNATSNTPRCDHICYQIEKWHTAAVEEELKRRGLTPRTVSDNPQSLMMKDINGYGLQISGTGFLPTGAPPPSKPAAGAKGFHAVSIEHVSYLADDYHKTADFYANLLGMKPYNDTGKAVNLLLADKSSYMVIRNATSDTPRCDHICYQIDKWDTTAVGDELKRRGLSPRVVSDNPQSFMLKDVNGYGLQISGKGFLPTGANSAPSKQ
jgi:catechol 2,3-dioxygenase-like lactoylglutathione lyase family enzyme